MKHDLTTGTWQDNTGCPISIILVTTSDAAVLGSALGTMTPDPHGHRNGLQSRSIFSGVD
jgi:hypothetical protein